MPGGGMSSAVWGPHFWRVIHGVAWFTRDAQRARADTFARFFGTLGAVLPCGRCRANYAHHSEQLARAGLTPRSAAALGAVHGFAHELHARVNAKMRADNCATSCDLPIGTLNKRLVFGGAPGFSRTDLQCLLLAPAFNVRAGGAVAVEDLERFYAAVADVLLLLPSVAQLGVSIGDALRRMPTRADDVWRWATELLGGDDLERRFLAASAGMSVDGRGRVAPAAADDPAPATS